MPEISEPGICNLAERTSPNGARYPNLQPGDMVIATDDFDPAGADVRKGMYGVCFYAANHYGDGCGPMVRWFGGGACNAYSDMCRRVSRDEVNPFSAMDEYQHQARATAVYQNIGRNPRYAMIGLCEEVGEVAGQLKRVERDDGDVVTPDRREKIKLEMGDCMWYLASLAAELGLTLSEIARANIAKLADRKARKALHGSGDSR